MFLCYHLANLTNMKDLGYKSGTIEQAKFEYFPLHQIFNKDLERDDKTNGLLKRL